MNDTLIRQATCRVTCARETGTGWLVTHSHVVTARHCVAAAIEEGAEIMLQFGTGEAARQINASIVAHDADLDVCLLLLPNELSLAPITVTTMLPREGAAWSAFGYPVVKLNIGHRAEGIISQVLDSPEMSVDLDLHVTGGSDLTDYRGLSGSPLICEGQCHGMIRLAVDRPVCAISTARVAGFLQVNGIAVSEPGDADESRSRHAERVGFQAHFEQRIVARAGGYLFLEGAHGTGKTTFCEAFRPTSGSLEVFGTYSFTAPRRGINAMHRAQPEVFHDWLSTLVSMRGTARPARVSEKSYHQLISETGALMAGVAQEYARRETVGVLFIDGLDEAARLGGNELPRFLGLLPSTLPPGLVIVLTAPNHTTLSSMLGARVEAPFVLTLPSLTREAMRDYCMSELTRERVAATTVALICDKAEGNALYLHYLIDYANGGATDEQIAEVPGFGGSIRNYYESLWGHLIADTEASNLLGILARLRWGVPMAQLSDLLTEAERVAFVPTVHRIRHLLRDPRDTSIYHASFADFLVEKTGVREHEIQRRLADYCRRQASAEYGTLNLIYHALRAGPEDVARGVADCQQEWVDRCVTLGIEPDMLLGDIGDALGAATTLGDPVEVVRILLMSHRLDFRYDTLFAQSASLIAEALIAVGRGDESLQHAIRYGRLIVPPAEALRIALKLIQGGRLDAARDLLEKADVLVMQRLSASNLAFSEFVELAVTRAQLLLFQARAGDENAMDGFARFNLVLRRVVERGVTDESTRRLIAVDITSALSASMVAVNERYMSLAMLERVASRRPSDILETNLSMLVHYQSLRAFLSVGVNSELLPRIFADLRTLIADAEAVPACDMDVLDALIELAAPPSVIEALASTTERQEQALDFLREDMVSVDLERLRQGFAHRRVISYLRHDLACPPACDWSSGGWLENTVRLLAVLAWCDGAARRAKAEQDSVRLREVWDLLSECVLEPLRLTLRERASWQNAYAIPEVIFPEVYKVLTGLCLEVYPERLELLLTRIEEQFPGQCGLYSEGFRQVLLAVVESLAGATLESEVGNRSFALLRQWSSYIQRNVKNRHELVPELLRLIPLFARWGAHEEARRIHQVVLSVSMGPTWYKEDQLSLLVGTLEHFPSTDLLEADVLPRIAGSLERASGEMTFQRYIRYDKAALLSELCRRGHHADAVRYFLRQSCGTTEELFADALQGEMDRPSPLRGLRFPGGALDEQDAILRMVQSIGENGNWDVCWALLEVYQHGDDRHIASFAAAYARLAGCAGDAAERALMRERLLLLVKSELSKEESEGFLEEFSRSLSPALNEEFEEVLRLRQPGPIGEQAASSVSEVNLESTAGQEAPGNLAQDDMLLPGTFGTARSTRESSEALVRAQAHLDRLNIEAARAEALSALELLQGGGWSIWGNLSSEAARAEQLLRHGVDDPSALVKSYAPLIILERHVEKWRRADHLISRIGLLLNPTQRAAITQVVLDHIRHLVGDPSIEASQFSFLGGSKQTSASDALLTLLVTIVDHPKWIRQARAADMILWLLETRHAYLSSLAPIAFSMGTGLQADVICGALDSLSMSRPMEFWEELAAVIDLDRLLVDCNHAGRLAVLLRIATRGALAGAQSAASALARITERLDARVAPVDTRVSDLSLPPWARMIESEWRALAARGLVDANLVQRIEANMVASCAPISISTSFELEELLSLNFREPMDRPLARWEARLRHAVLVALMPMLTEADLLFVEELFRPYNPMRPHRLRRPDFLSPAGQWFDELSRGRIASVVPVRDLDIYLDLQVRMQQGNRFRYLRMTAFLYRIGSSPVPPNSPATFKSTDIAQSDRAGALELCARVDPRPALFGTFTPAIPSHTLIQAIEQRAAPTRGYWRETRISSARDPWPQQEGCFLSIEKSALKLPEGLAIAWEVELDGFRFVHTPDI